MIIIKININLNIIKLLNEYKPNNYKELIDKLEISDPIIIEDCNIFNILMNTIKSAYKKEIIFIDGVIPAIYDYILMKTINNNSKEYSNINRIKSIFIPKDNDTVNPLSLIINYYNEYLNIEVVNHIILSDILLYIRVNYSIHQNIEKLYNEVISISNTISKDIYDIAYIYINYIHPFIKDDELDLYAH